jgi:hypothetical protein
MILTNTQSPVNYTSHGMFGCDHFRSYGIKTDIVYNTHMYESSYELTTVAAYGRRNITHQNTVNYQDYQFYMFFKKIMYSNHLTF